MKTNTEGGILQTQVVRIDETTVQNISPELRILSLQEFIEACTEFNQNNPDIDISQMEACPVHVYASQINKPCYGVIATILTCPVCGRAACPVCGSHNVEQISRVTGYVQAVSGWNAAKKQELLDRQRYNIGNGNGNEHGNGHGR